MKIILFGMVGGGLLLFAGILCFLGLVVDGIGRGLRATGKALQAF